MTIKLSEILNGYLYDFVKNLDDMDFFNKVVQFDDDPNNVATGEATFIFAGPPVLNPPTKFPGAGGDIKKYLKPIGAVQQYSLQVGKQIIPFNELGSCLKRHATGTGMYSASFARVLSRHSDIRYAFYSWLKDFVKLEHGGDDSIELALLPGETASDRGRHFVGTESEIFRIPFGILCITGSAGGDAIHVEYLERCFYQGGGKAAVAGNTMIVPNASISVTRPVAFVDSNGSNLLTLRDRSLLADNKKQGYVLLDAFKSIV